jgi:hypothetical protein
MLEHQKKAYAYFQKEGFLPVGKESYSLFKKYDHDDVRLHETSATVSTIWAFAYNAIYKVVGGYLCSVWFYRGGEVYVIVQHPRETRDFSLQDVVDTLYGFAAGAGLPSLHIWAVEERFLAEYLAVKGYEITSGYSDDWSEYAYRIGDLLELSGGVNLNKRNRLKKFLNRQDISLLPIDAGNIRTCLEIEDQWCRRQDCEYCGSFTGCARKSLEAMIGIFDSGVYGGIFGCIDNVPAGYAIWEKRSKKVAFLYFAKANVADFNVYLYYILAKAYLSGTEYLNIGHDMGKPGLRTFKKHLSSHELWRKYLCVFTKAGERTQ